MEITLNTEILKEIIFIAVGLVLFILIVYCIFFLKHLIATMKKTGAILDDTQVISGIAAERAKDVDKIIGDVSESVGSISDVIKGNQNVVKALTSIVNAVGSLKNLLRKN